MSKDNEFELEWQNTLQILSDKNANLSEFKYFLDLAKDYFKFYIGNGSQKVILLGNYFPDEIIRAMGIDFCYVFGGSYESTLFCDVNLPKDTDDEIRSIVGILRSSRLNLSKDDVVLVPLCNDNMKKLKALVSDLATVMCYEVPFDKEDSLQRKRFLNEIGRVTAELEKYFKKKLSSKKLKEQCDNSKKAAVAFCKFEKLFKENTIVLAPSTFLFIANSYCMCKDKIEWALNLERLVCQLEKGKRTNLNSYSKILLFGSPIYVPNYKTLFAIEESNLQLYSIIHPDIEHIKELFNIEDKNISIKYLATKYLESDVSAAFAKNSTMNNLIMEEINSGKIKGVIANIIKGQIAYDYAFKNIEKLTENYKIPLNRIETVSNYSDIEQIKLRLEAFSEMLMA